MSQTSDMSRDEAESLLVFLANDTLEGDERAAVQAAVAKDAALAADLSALRNMRRSMQDAAPIQSPGALGLARLMREIDGESQTKADASQVVANSPAAPRFWKIAAVVLLGLFAAQSAFVYLGGSSGSPDLKLASGGAPTLGQGTTFRVEFATDTSVGEIAALLLDLDLTIVDGPSAIGFYTLKASDAASYDQAVDVLQDKPDLVTIVE